MAKDTVPVGFVRLTTPQAKKYAEGMLEGVNSHMEDIGAPKVWSNLANDVLFPFMVIGVEAQSDGVSAYDFRKFTAWTCAAILFEASTSTSSCEGENADVTLVASAGEMVQLVANQLSGMVEERIKQLRVQ